MTPLAARLRKRMLAIDGVVESAGIFGEGDAFWVNGKQMANWTADDTIEVRLTKPEIRVRREALRADRGITLRGNSDWVGVRFSSANDLPLVLELVEAAASVYRAPAGTTPAPPPEGAKLARMRRFH